MAELRTPPSPSDTDAWDLEALKLRVMYDARVHHEEHPERLDLSQYFTPDPHLVGYAGLKMLRFIPMDTPHDATALGIKQGNIVRAWGGALVLACQRLIEKERSP